MIRLAALALVPLLFAAAPQSPGTTAPAATTPATTQAAIAKDATGLALVEVLSAKEVDNRPSDGNLTLTVSLKIVSSTGQTATQFRIVKGYGGRRIGPPPELKSPLLNVNFAVGERYYLEFGPTTDAAPEGVLACWEKNPPRPKSPPPSPPTAWPSPTRAIPVPCARHAKPCPRRSFFPKNRYHSLILLEGSPCPPRLAYYIHDLNPYIFRIAGWGPRWYGMAYLLGFLVAYLLLKKQARDGMLRMRPSLVPDFVLNGCIFGVLVGGRLGYCLFYQPSLLGFDSQFPYWGVLRVWDGGMSAHGGVVFTILTILWFAWKYKVPYVNLGDAACMVVPVGLFFGRCANFINGELYGHPATVPWAVKFPSEVYAPTNGTIDPNVQAQLPRVFTDLKLPIDWFQPSNLVMNDGLSALDRLLVAHDPQAVLAVANIIPARHPSQLYEALLEGLLLFLICYFIGRLWKKDGMAAGAFLTFYPIMRIIGEQFRVGDTPILIAGREVSKGVLYSAPMVLVGILYWVYCMWRDRPSVWAPVPDEPDNAAAPVPARKSA